jgi:transcriptional regulator with XRE-family HTH domain
MKTGHSFLDPKILGFWVRCLREAQHISQDALAVLSGVDIRTVQRMEAGNAVAVTSRRCIAKALGFEKADIFDDPEFIADVHRLLDGLRKINEESLDKQHPEHVQRSGWQTGRRSCVWPTKPMRSC